MCTEKINEEDINFLHLSTSRDSTNSGGKGQSKESFFFSLHPQIKNSRLGQTLRGIYKFQGREGDPFNFLYKALAINVKVCWPYTILLYIIHVNPFNYPLTFPFILVFMCTHSTYLFIVSRCTNIERLKGD